MASFSSKAVNFMMRNRHFFRGRLKKESFDLNTSIPAFRELCEKGAAKYNKLPHGITINTEVIEGLKSEWLIPDGADRNKLILYVHGGGYVSGSCSDHRGIVSKFAHRTGFTTLLFEYRLAPENPFPAALNDTVKIYQRLLSSGFLSTDILIAGESAGGGLCLATLLALKKQKIPLPVAVVAISPWTDLSCSGDSYQTKNRKSVAPLNSWKIFSRHYVGKNDVRNPLISPLFGNLKGLPPIFINSAEDDELFDDGKNFSEKAKKQGGDITFRAGKAMVHCYPLLAPLFPEATEAMNEMVNYIQLHFQSQNGN